MDAEAFYSNPEAMLKALGAGSFGGLPMPKMATPQSIERAAEPLRQRIFDNFETLRAILDRHELTIHKRWMKKTKEQKRKILLAAWGTKMSTTHRPDFAALYKEGPSTNGRKTANRDAFVFPYINQEDLLKPKTLLMFLRTRARHQPADFAAADLTALHIAITSQAVVPEFLNEHIMIFTGRTDPKTYGELVHWDDHPHGFEWLQTQRAPHPGQGVLILEVQDRVMAFLVACTKQILHEMAGDDTWSKYPIQPEPSLASSSVDEQPSWAALAAEAPYRPPSQLNFADLEALLGSRRDAAADHMWALREDPGYFADQMSNAREHRQETLTDDNGRRHPLFTSGREEILWNRVLGNEVMNAYLQHETLVELHTQAGHLTKLQRAINVSPEDELPKHYMDAILRFQYYLTQVIKGPIALLKVSFVASPPMRQYFSRTPVSDPADTRISTGSKPGVRLEPAVSKLFWLLRTLWEDGQQLFLLKTINVVDELQRLIDTEAQARASVSSFVAAIIADLSIYSECLRQLDLYQPWANTFEDEFVGRKEGVQQEFAQTSRPWAEAQHAIMHGESIYINYGIPSERRFSYPVEKRRTRENVEQLRLAEKNLDLFWSKLDKSMTRELGNLTIASVLAKRTMQRTAPWIDPVPGNTQTAIDISADELIKPLSDIYLDLQLRTEKTLGKDVIAPTNKLKEKTRGTAKSPISNETEQERDQSRPVKSPSFAVDSRALKAFRTLFFTPSTTATPGELAWTDFLHAMASTGFSIRKLYGSVWQFSPTRLDVEASIQFHEPHPSGKIPYRTARRHGRRLHRTYGWDVSMFTLAEAAA